MEIDPELLSGKTLERIDEAVKEFRKGRFVSEEEIDKLLDL